jgi:hypothetical protein
LIFLVYKKPPGGDVASAKGLDTFMWKLLHFRAMLYLETQQGQGSFTRFMEACDPLCYFPSASGVAVLPLAK